MSPHTAARDNPFASHRIDRLVYRAPGFRWEELLARLDAVALRGAIVGPHGSGKTTLLDGLQPRLEGPGRTVRRLTLHSEDTRPLQRLLTELRGADLGATIVVLDGAEQLSTLAWHRFRHRCRGARGLLITTHRPGRLPTVHRTATTPALLAELVAELAPDLPEAWSEELPGLWAEHGGNLRECLRELYDTVSRRKWR